jgi:aspartokinase
MEPKAPRKDSNAMRVMKFGGTSVGNAVAIDRTARIIADAYRGDGRLVAVVSAMSGVTNQLIAAAQAAAEGDEQAVARLQQELVERHRGASPRN